MVLIFKIKIIIVNRMMKMMIIDNYCQLNFKRWGRLTGLCGLLRVALSCNLSQRKKQKILVFYLLLLPET